MNYDETTTDLQGQYGRAVRIALPDRPEMAATIAVWIVTSPIWHAGWSQYLISVVRLTPGLPGLPDPVLKFPGASHELAVITLDPRHGPYTRRRVTELDFHVPSLMPVNILEQFEATDTEMRLLAGYCALGVVNGVLCPETSDTEATTEIRERWLTSMVQTLAHLRGEEHAAPPPAPRNRKPYRDPLPGEQIEIAISPGITIENRHAIEEMMRQTHDGLLEMVGDRRRSQIRWHHVHGALSCNEWLDQYVASTEPERRAAVDSMADQYRAFIAEHGDETVLVIANCDAGQ